MTRCFTIRRPVLILAMLIFSVLFSCGSNPAPVSESETESIDRAASLSESGEAPVQDEEESGEPREAAGEPELSAGQEPVNEASPPLTDAGIPDTVVPPEVPAEREAELPEPRPLTLASPRPETPSFRMTPAPPPSMVPRSQPSREPPSAGDAGSLPVTPPQAQPQTPPALPRQEAPPLPVQPPPGNEPAPPPRQPPSPPPFIKPAEPEIPPPVREPVPVPVNPLPELPSRALPETAAGEIVFSRIVRALTGQTVVIPFRGTGWVYLGELGNRQGIGYDSRRLDLDGSGITEGQSFIFHAEAAGTYVLKFYKQDFIQDYIINDYVQVIVGDDPAYSERGRAAFPVDRGRVVAEPRWPPPDTAVTQSVPFISGSVSEGSPAEAARSSPPVPETSSESRAVAPVPPAAETAASPVQAPADDGIVSVTPPQAVPPVSPPPEDSAGQTAEAAPAVPEQYTFSRDDPPDEYIRRAKQEFDAGRVEPALTILDAMKLRYPSGTDEAWWLYAQLLEANSPSRDIRLALEYYRRLVREYPQSPRAGDALRRIAYLERYYFNIR